MLNIYEAINAGIKRISDLDGNFVSASFSLSDGDYVVTSDFHVHKDGRELPVHGCKGDIYPEVCICGYPMKAYVLSMIAVDPMFVSEYLKGGVVVNHCLCTMRDGGIHPHKDVWFNPAYLEVISNGDNVRHGRFIKKYGLTDVYVSARDIANLEPMMFSLEGVEDDTLIEEIKETNRSLVESYYLNKGIKKKLRF